MQTVGRNLVQSFRAGMCAGCLLVTAWFAPDATMAEELKQGSAGAGFGADTPGGYGGQVVRVSTCESVRATMDKRNVAGGRRMVSRLRDVTRTMSLSSNARSRGRRMRT